MKSLMIAAALAATTFGATVATTSTASAQPRYWHGRAHGPEYRAWRRGYYGRWHRYPVRVCGPRRCFYR